MSWDVMVFDLGENPPPLEEMGADFKPKSLGLVSELRQTISAHLPQTDWSDPSWGICECGDFVLEFSMGTESKSDGFMVHVRGGGNALEALWSFALPNGWSLYDCSTGDFIDPESPEETGWLGFQKFRDYVVGDENL